MVLVAGAVLGAALLADTAGAQRIGSLAEWKKRVLDPASIGLETYPGAAFNMKFTIDQIRLDESKAEIALYVIPLSDVGPAAEFFAKQLGTPIETTERGSLGTLRVVRAKADDPKRAGLTVSVGPAEWATGKGQILLHDEASPPEAPPD